MLERRCFQCREEARQDQTYCGKCGSPLVLSEFVARNVQEQLSASLRDRKLIETESAIRVFERAWGWVKIVGGIIGFILVLSGALLTWRVHDLNSAVTNAKDSVDSTSNQARDKIQENSSKALSSINQMSQKAEEASSQTTRIAEQKSEDIRRQGAKASAQFDGEAASIKKEVDVARSQIRSASELQPQMKTMQNQLGEARDQLQAQQKVLSSSETFIKHVFSSHAIAVINLNNMASDQYVVVPPPSSQIKNTVLYVLLPASPIPGTIQLQYRFSIQPPNSYFSLHNLLIFFWGDPPEALKASELTASYFPDSEDRDSIHKLIYKDGRVFADGEALPKFGQPDIDFKGSKWIPMVTLPPPTVTPKVKK